MDELIIAGLAGLVAGGSLMYMFWVHPERVAKWHWRDEQRLMSEIWEKEKKILNNNYEELRKMYLHLFEQSDKMQIALADRDKTIAELRARMGNTGPWLKSLDDLNKIIQYLTLKRENPSQVIACSKETAEHFCEFLNYLGTNGVLRQAPHHAQFAYGGFEFIFTEDQETIRRSKSSRIAMDQLDLNEKYAHED